ncbi:MAG: pyruvate formate lyase family protein [Eubacteriales bacterium]
MEIYDYITSDAHRALRTTLDWDLAGEFSARGLCPEERMTERFERLCAAQTPRIFAGEQIVFTRSTVGMPDVFTPDEWAEIKSKHYIHELGFLSNVTPDYSRVLSRGLLAVREGAGEYARRDIDALLSLSDRYRDEAVRQGRSDIAETLDIVPRYPARTLRQSLQFFRIVHFAMWLDGSYHVTCGRFDKYMYPYYRHDIDAGIYTGDELLTLMRDFFLSFNKDSDLYVGVQQGDNGQSMVLGGIDADGHDVWSGLSELCLRASAENRLIDPKINMRVSKAAPPQRYIAGSRLTAVGMGFPQYSNDDVVIPGLERLGYSRDDARDYGVAACWEFIVPGGGADIANIAALSFPRVIDRALHSSLERCGDIAQFEEAVREEIFAECSAMCDSIKDVWFSPAPFMSLFFDTPLGDISRGSRYNNFGMHGTGLATAADSIAAIAKYVFADKTISARALIEAVDSDFAEHSELLPILRYEAPKMGINMPDGSENPADAAACFLLSSFADALDGRRNCRGGIWRAGTGSAMYYLWHAREIGASPDGRRAGEAFGTNYSPSLFARTDGPVSVIRSFTAPRLIRNINGGPLTLEFDASIFKTEDALEKVASLVRFYIERGGHQLQLNSVSRETLLDAQAHPEKYRRLIVRIWGWSAYFVELDREYQDHVIARREFTV